MTTPRFIQFHALTSYTGTLINRDDSGLAKTLLYGGTPRTRISSQCLKRHWRKDDGEYSLMNISPDPVRTKELADRAILKQVREALPQLDDAAAEAALMALNVGLYGEKGNDANSRQPLLFGQHEVEFLSNQVADILREHSDPDAVIAAVQMLFNRKENANNFHAFRHSQTMPAGIIGAMFGRMITSDPDANIDAAVHVAHAFTTHGEEKEIDYFTAMEDLTHLHRAGHIGESEINSGIYYVYVCVDTPALTANTTGCAPDDWLDQDRSIAAETVSRLAGLIATVSPGAKKGSTAPYAYANAMLVEAGERQPRSLASAYRTPSRPQLEDAIDRLETEVETHDRVYGTHEARCRFTGRNGQDEGTLERTVNWLRDAVANGAV